MDLTVGRTHAHTHSHWRALLKPSSRDPPLKFRCLWPMSFFSHFVCFFICSVHLGPLNPFQTVNRSKTLMTDKGSRVGWFWWALNITSLWQRHQFHFSNSCFSTGCQEQQGFETSAISGLYCCWTAFLWAYFAGWLGDVGLAFLWFLDELLCALHYI